MKVFGMSAAAVGLALTFFVSGCSGGGSGGSGSGGSGSGGTMFIETCSLGCGGGQGGSEVACSIVETFVNADVFVVFSQPVDPNSVTSETFNIKDANSAAIPPGTLLVDPSNPRRVIFRPLISFVNGSPVFGLTDTATYKITIAGESSGAVGPFIRSTGGRNNKSRMRCTIKPNQGVTDVVSGPPTVDVLVSTADLTTVDPLDFIADVNADGAVDVWRNSTIRFIFRDVMNPATVLDANTQTPPSGGLSIKFDVDGNLATDTDQVPLPGTYSLDPPDQALLRTVLTFTPSNGIPSAGDPLFNPDPRQVVIRLPPTIRDLAGNPLGEPSLLACTPEVVLFPAQTLPDVDGENFATTANQNTARSGAVWAGGRLQRGVGGGSGRLGDLHIGTGQTLTLNTDSQTFPLASTPNDLLVDVAPGVVPSITVTDGIFEFSSILIEPGGTLILEGVNAARVFARGEANIQAFGVLDVSGHAPVAQSSDRAVSNLSGRGGPAGGDGGQGGDRADNSANPTILALSTEVAGISNPGAVTDGERGGGVGRSVALANSAGAGGARFPNVFPTNTDTVGPGAGGLKFTFVDPNCDSQQVSSGGAGGAYAQDGRAAFIFTPNFVAADGSSNVPSSAAAGGLTSAVGIEAPDPESGHNVRRLRAEFGHLRGGAGGGGGGTHLFGTRSSFVPEPCAGVGQPISAYFDHSSASGGGGGGALQLVSGSTLTVSGKILALGGNGGSAVVLDDPNELIQRKTRSSPGGAGSGGAIRLQGIRVAVDTNSSDPVRLDVRGGFGGTNSLGGVGGRGGHGLVRIEDQSGVISRVTESPKIGPFLPGHINPATGLEESENVVSVASWAVPRLRPESFSGAVSCWMRPAGNYFRLIFTEDDVPNGIYGWNMDVVYDAGAGEVLLKYRGPDASSPFSPTPLEDVVGLQNGLNYPITQNCVGDYFAVRFQGAQAITDISANPCDVALSSDDPDQPSQIAAGSLTPWVRHPSELNDFEPRPNMIRFAVVFDGRMIICGAPATFVKGITNLKIQVRPD